MYVHFYALGALAVCIAVGFCYRISAILFFLGFTYVFLLEQAHYLNHFYMVGLISFLMIFVPAHRAFSIDALLRPGIRSGTVPAWSLWILRAQVGIVYFYGGIAKLNSDWLSGEPMRTWLAQRTDFPVIGGMFTDESVVYLFSYGGLLLDLLIVPLLLWRRTRLPAFFLAATFHILNALLFRIGIFPWFMLAATLLFFPPDWPRRLLQRIGISLSPRANNGRTVPSKFPRTEIAALLLLGGYFLVQLLLPLRHHLYPGDVNWTEEGHRFSWRMKLRDKSATLRFVANADTTSLDIDPDDYLEPWQIEEMSSRPDMILQFVHHVAGDLYDQGYRTVEIFAWVRASLNGRKAQLLIDPSVDLARQPETLGRSLWIRPLVEKLPPPGGASYEGPSSGE